MHAGRPMHFVRLSGCNLECTYCDTPDNDSGDEYSIDEVTSKVSDPAFFPVYITGGEPLLQDETLHLIVKLLSEGREVHLDTNGTVDLKAVAPNTHKVIDIKTPGSGAGNSFLESNLEYINNTDEIKFIVTSQDDFTWAFQAIHNLRLFNLTPNILFQPAWGMVDPKDLVEWVKSCDYPIRVSVQIHKYIWGPNTKGV